jgi:sporulation protein YunB
MLLVTTKKKLKKYAGILVFILILTGIGLYFGKVTYPFILNIAEAEAKQAAMKAINTAAEKISKLDAFYGEFYDVEKNSNGDIILVKAKPSAINKMYVAAQVEIQRALNDLNGQVIDIPLGAFTGSTIFADVGPEISINLKVIGTSEASWHSYFTYEGINQTLHRMAISVSTKINILIPMRATDITINTEFTVSEDVIVGKVPETYISGLEISKDNLFDLLPG